MKLLYPHQISLNTRPRKGKKYGLIFTWRATEDLSERNIRDAFEVVVAHFRSRYGVEWLEPVGLVPLWERFTMNFVLKEDSSLTVGQMWQETKAFALERYLNLTLQEAVIWKPAFPWWVLLIIAGEVGAITGAAKRKA